MKKIIIVSIMILVMVFFKGFAFGFTTDPYNPGNPLNYINPLSPYNTLDYSGKNDTTTDNKTNSKSITNNNVNQKVEKEPEIISISEVKEQGDLCNVLKVMVFSTIVLILGIIFLRSRR